MTESVERVLTRILEELPPVLARCTDLHELNLAWAELKSAVRITGDGATVDSQTVPRWREDWAPRFSKVFDAFGATKQRIERDQAAGQCSVWTHSLKIWLPISIEDAETGETIEPSPTGVLEAYGAKREETGLGTFLDHLAAPGPGPFLSRLPVQITTVVEDGAITAVLELPASRAPTSAEALDAKRALEEPFFKWHINYGFSHIPPDVADAFAIFMYLDHRSSHTVVARPAP